MKEKSLASCNTGETLTVSRLDTSGVSRRRLSDLGLIPGTLVTCLFKAPSGNPAAYLIRGTVIAIRRTDAEKIYVS